jgi:1,4-alpha-glucan branching enzyme
MLYLDYGREPGEWNPNPDGSNYCLEAIAFFKKLNKVVREEVPDALMIAEEATSYPGITAKDGLGFSMKWNMGWMNDTLDYIETDSFFRKCVHNKMTFSLMYSFSENYILPISHDEVVHGKHSLVDKMFGDYEQKFACAKTYLAYMFAHPGKKLTFMGCEYAQFREWDYANSLEWFMLKYDKHRAFQTYNKELNHFYLAHKPMWEIEDSFDGFHWLSADDRDNNIYAFERRDSHKNIVYVVLNFSPNPYMNYYLPVEENGEYDILLNSDDEQFGGHGMLREKKLVASENCLRVNVPPLTALYLIRKKIIADI